MTTIRPYRAEDRATCAQLVHDAVHHGAAAFYTPQQRAAWCPSPEPDLSKPDRFAGQIALVAEEETALVGVMSIVPARAYLDMAYVAPHKMGTGVAARLLRQLTDTARARGLTRLTTDASHLARRFFEKHGWRVDGLETVERDGQRLERFSMSTDLRDPA